MPTRGIFNRKWFLCYKLRKKPNVIEEMSIIGEVEGRNVVIIDDMVDTAGTLVLAANMMKERGATSIRAFATHPILSGNAVERINDSAIEELVVSDSVPFINNSKKIKVLSIADIFAKTIQAVNYKSVNKHKFCILIPLSYICRPIFLLMSNV